MWYDMRHLHVRTTGFWYYIIIKLHPPMYLKVYVPVKLLHVIGTRKCMYAMHIFLSVPGRIFRQMLHLVVTWKSEFLLDAVYIIRYTNGMLVCDMSSMVDQCSMSRLSIYNIYIMHEACALQPVLDMGSNDSWIWKFSWNLSWIHELDVSIRSTLS